MRYHDVSKIKPPAFINMSFGGTDCLLYPVYGDSSSETTANFNRAVRRHISEDGTHQYEPIFTFSWPTRCTKKSPSYLKRQETNIVVSECLCCRICGPDTGGYEEFHLLGRKFRSAVKANEHFGGI
jgi:hypothetical protein